MKTSFSIVVWMLAVSILLKMFIFSMDLQFTNYERITFFGNIFILMAGIFFGIRLFKIQSATNTSFVSDFKAGMRIASTYAIFMCAFVYLYYSMIDPTYFSSKLAAQLAQAEGSGLDMENARKTGEFVLSPFFQSTVTLIGFILLGTFYSSILPFLMRKIGGFGHK